MQRQKYVWLFLTIVSVLLTSLAMPANAGDLIVSRSYHEDPSNLLTYDQIKDVEFTPFNEMLNAGYKSGSLWVRLVLAKSNQETVLRVKPPYIDDIDLYDKGTKIYSIVDGAHQPGSQNRFVSLPYAFLLPPADEERVLYLRFKSAHSYQVMIDALPTEQFDKNDRVEQLTYTGYITFTLILALWLLIIWLIDRNTVVGVFTIQQFMGFTHSFITAGFAQFFFDRTLSASFINNLSFTIIITYPLVGFIANKLLLNELGLSKPFKLFANTLIACSLALVALFILGNNNILKWNALLVLSGMTFFWFAAIFGVKRSENISKSERFLLHSFRIYYTANLVLWLIAIIPLLGLWNVGTVAFQSLFAYNILSGLMLFFLLQCRYRYRLEREVARTSALDMQVISEKKQREELAMMMAMLSHEIKTPLSILKLVVDEKVKGSDLEGHASRALSNIGFVINRCLQLGKLDAENIKVQRSKFNVNNTIKNVVSDHGIDANDRITITGDPNLYFDSDLNFFRVAIANLIDNALKYSPKESVIKIDFHVSAGKQGNGLFVFVVNKTGILGAPDPSQVFKKYYRNQSATKISGSGLGLFLVSELIRILDGEISYSLQENRAVFTIWIPD